MRPPVYNREEADLKTNQTLDNRVKFALKYSLKYKKTDVTSEEFISLVKTICHPFVSKNNKDLKGLIKTLEEIFTNGKLAQYFEANQKALVDFAIRERSGILSHNATLRSLSINIGVVLASQNLFEAFIDDLAKIMNYKPLEMIQKLEKVFVEEFDRISFYDLMFYSEVAKDLLNVFSARDIATIKKELAQQAETAAVDGAGSSPSALEEEKEEAPSKAIDPSKLAAMMLKQSAAAKKGGAGAKKPAVAASKPTPAKSSAPAKKTAPKDEAHQPVDKEKRNKADRQQLIDCMQEMQRIKGQQIEAALEIVKRVN